MLYNYWLPGQHNIWKGGAFSVLSQAAIGSGYNFVSEFALDILHKFGIKKEAKTVTAKTMVAVAATERIRR